mgnify:CR=1 FL=1
MNAIQPEVIPHRVVRGPSPEANPVAAKPPKKARAKKPTLTERIQPLLISAYFWYVLLAVSGSCILSAGVTISYGIGYGLIAFGALSILGSEVLRRGMTRV